MVNGLKVGGFRMMRVGLVALLPCGAMAQDFGSALIGGMAQHGADRAQEFSRNAPGMIEDVLVTSKQAFETEEECLAQLQLAVNAGVAIGNSMPFSNVWIFETEQGPTARFRLLINGMKTHTEIHCKGSDMIGQELAWEAETPPSAPYNNGTLSAAQGALSIQSLKEDQEEPEAEKEPRSLEETLEIGEGARDGSWDGEVIGRSVEQCWNVGALSDEALETSVTVSFELQPDGRPVVGSITMVEQSGDNEVAGAQAFEAARRAILRCGAAGFDLPASAHAEWKDVRITFDLEQGVQMR